MLGDVVTQIVFDIAMEQHAKLHENKTKSQYSRCEMGCGSIFLMVNWWNGGGSIFTFL